MTDHDVASNTRLQLHPEQVVSQDVLYFDLDEGHEGLPYSPNRRVDTDSPVDVSRTEHETR